MKKIFLISFLFLTGCCLGPDYSQVDPKNLKFKLGQKVKIVTSNFYSDCTGVITGYLSTYDKKTGIYRYYMDLYCPKVFVKDAFADEFDLQAVEEKKK